MIEHTLAPLSRSIALALLVSALAGCYGDNGDDSDTTVTPTPTPTPSTNTAPTANAGVDKSVIAGSTVTLDASASSDADDDNLTYTWTTISLPTGGTATLSSSSAVSPTFVPNVEGTYTFQVTVSDGTSSATDQVTVTANAATSTSSGTSGVLCDYSDSTYNDSASVEATSTSAWTCATTTRDLVANGIPDHDVGTFPNDGNPNTISEQSVSVSYTLEPSLSTTSTTLGGPSGAQGYVLNGVKIDASTAGSCDDTGTSCSLIDNSGNWSIEALGHDHFDFGTDDNNAHVQPDGAYHYHGMPEGFISKRGGNSSTMTLIAWAADGFPIYARYGYTDASDATSALKNMTGSYQLVSTVSTTRPSTDTYILGTFQQDWEYVAGSGDLDECNGRTGVTPEFPDGIYHYYATDSYPYFQRCVNGTVESSGSSAGGPPAGGPPS